MGSVGRERVGSVGSKGREWLWPCCLLKCSDVTDYFALVLRQPLGLCCQGYDLMLVCIMATAFCMN